MSSEGTILDILPASLQQPQTYIVLSLVIFILVLFAVIYKRNLSISILGRNLLDVQSKDSSSNSNKSIKGKFKGISSNLLDKDTTQLSAHAGCPYVNDFILIISETTKVVSEISEIKYKGCISEQMFRADQHLIRLRTILQSKYRTLLSKKVNEEVEISGDNLVAYKFYQALTRIVIQDIKDLIIRVAFLNNHLADFETQSDYNFYIDKQFESIKNVIVDTTVEMYMGDWVINQRSVMEMHEDTFSDLKKVVEDIYNDSRDIAIKSKRKIIDMEKRLKNFVTKIAGVNGQVV